jgi:putative transposase
VANTYTDLIYHIVFSTKERRPFIKEAVQADLYRYIGGIIRQEGGMLIEIGGVSDHLHIVMRLKPSKALADVVRTIKAKSSKWVRGMEQRNAFQWQRGYGAFSISESRLNDVTKYVKRQQEHHRRMSFREEYIMLLERHGIEYDERYLP